MSHILKGRDLISQLHLLVSATWPDVSHLCFRSVAAGLSRPSSWPCVMKAHVTPMCVQYSWLLCSLWPTISTGSAPLALHVCAYCHYTMSVPVQREASQLRLHHWNKHYVMTLSEYLINSIATTNQYHIHPSQVTSLGWSELQFGHELCISHFVFHYALSFELKFIPG